VAHKQTIVRRKESTNKTGEPARNRGPWLVCTALVLVTLAVFGRACANGFVNFDDTFYASDNHRVQGGLTADNVRWTLTSTEHANWHPLTWLSLQLDATLYGRNAFGFHTTSVLLHVANTLLLFFLLHRATGALAEGGMTAALFALHPLHVESVAWVGERKDVLSGLFWLLTMVAYGRYAARPSIGRYALMLALFSLGLMAKPMLVTLPLVLMLWDVWPLGRWAAGSANHKLAAHTKAKRERGNSLDLPHLRFGFVSRRLLLLEKIPLLLLSAASCLITVVAQHRTGAIRSGDVLPLVDRLAHVPIAYCEYLSKTFLPLNLAAYYPYSRTSVGPVLLATAALALVTIWTIRRRQRQPFLAVGWLWFLGTLVPTIGLVQVGGQSIADRYTYIPLIGLFTAVVWGVAELVRRGHLPRPFVAAGTLAGLGFLAICSFRQAGYWRDSVTLWSRALEVTGENYQVCAGLGGALADAGRDAQAVPFLEAAASMQPTDGTVYANLGVVLLRLGRLAESEERFKAAMQLNARDDKAVYNLGCVRLAQGRTSDAVAEFERTLEINPLQSQAHLVLAELLAVRGEGAAAQEHFERALQINRDASLAAWRKAHPDAPDAAALAEQAAVK
jgi:tetratricopeptide (TPR) repeat protein